MTSSHWARSMPVSGLVLAGGRSRRLGMDKALLHIDGQWLLQRTVKTLQMICEDVWIIANNGERLSVLGVPIVADSRPGTGVLGGIYTGLTCMSCECGVFVACDMPLLSLSLLQYMVSVAFGYDVVIPRVAGEIEPLHALYNKSCLAPIEVALEKGELRPRAFFPAVRVRYVEQEEVEAFDPELRSIININTPQDLQRVRKLMAAEHGGVET
jgi:molybdenum cofactor guanylyltransferase